MNDKKQKKMRIEKETKQKETKQKISNVMNYPAIELIIRFFFSIFSIFDFPSPHDGAIIPVSPGGLNKLTKDRGRGKGDRFGLISM